MQPGDEWRGFTIGEQVDDSFWGVSFAATREDKLYRLTLATRFVELKAYIDNTRRFYDALAGNDLAGLCPDERMMDGPQGVPVLLSAPLNGRRLDLQIEAFGPLSPGQAAFILVRICEGMAQAHARGWYLDRIVPLRLWLVRLHPAADTADVRLEHSWMNANQAGYLDEELQGLALLWGDLTGGAPLPPDWPAAPTALEQIRAACDAIALGPGLFLPTFRIIT